MGSWRHSPPEANLQRTTRLCYRAQSLRELGVSKLYTQIAMAEVLAQVADKIDRAVQRVTPLAYRMQRKGRRWMRRAMRKPRSVSEGPNLLPLLIQVLASFSKADGVLLEEEIDSSLGFLR